MDTYTIAEAAQLVGTSRGKLYQGRAGVYDCVAVTARFAAFWGLGERPANKRRQRTERQRDGG